MSALHLLKQPLPEPKKEEGWFIPVSFLNMYYEHSFGLQLQWDSFGLQSCHYLLERKIQNMQSGG